MKISERRYSPRYGLHVPLVFSAMHAPPRIGQQTKSINISIRGVYFVTCYPVFVGLPVRVSLKMPKRITGRIPTEQVFAGRISHVESRDVADCTSGVGVEFFYWEHSLNTATLRADSMLGEETADHRPLLRG